MLTCVNYSKLSRVVLAGFLKDFERGNVNKLILNEKSKQIAISVWQKFEENDYTFVNANEETTSEKLAQERMKIIPIILEWIKKYQNEEVELEEFKTAIDSINKKHRLWGFKGIKGMMFFNILTKTSIEHNHKTELDNLLKESISVPKDLDNATKIISQFKEFTEKMGEYHQDRRAAPNIKSILYFLSYFWQIQRPDEYPVYYPSMINGLSDLGIWTQSFELENDYRTFYEINFQLFDIFSKEAGRTIRLWEVELAFFAFKQFTESEEELQTKKADERVKERIKAESEIIELPNSYIPPIISIIPKLAVNDPELADLCDKSGKNIVKVFEERLGILFQMLGYDVKSHGQGRGRVPDGIAKSQQYHYAIIYDAKARHESYTMNATDERAVREYIKYAREDLRKEGLESIYIMIVSSKFTGNHKRVIRTLKSDTNINEVLMVEASALVKLLEYKIRNPDLTPNHFKELFSVSGIITVSDVKEIFD